MKTIFVLMRHVWEAGAFSPTAFIARAIMIALCYFISELAGLREYTTFLSGTSANLNLSWQTAATLGLLHLLLYVAFILLAPVSLITAGLLLLWDRWNAADPARHIINSKDFPLMIVEPIKIQSKLEHASNQKRPTAAPQPRSSTGV